MICARRPALSFALVAGGWLPVCRWEAVLHGKNWDPEGGGSAARPRETPRTLFKNKRAIPLYGIKGIPVLEIPFVPYKPSRRG